MPLRELIGNERVAKALTRAAARDRLPHALLFAGPDGVGKRTFAMELAKAVTCHAPVDGDACGECDSCVRAQSGEHPDIRVFVPEGTLHKIASMRDLAREAQYRHIGGLRSAIATIETRLAAPTADLLTVSERKTQRKAKSTAADCFLGTAHPPGENINAGGDIPAIANKQFSLAKGSTGAPIFSILAGIVQQIVKHDRRQFFLPAGKYRGGDISLQGYRRALFRASPGRVFASMA